MDDWTDDRLNEFTRGVNERMKELHDRQNRLDDKINGMPAKVESLGREMGEIKREITSPDGTVGRLARKIEEIIGNPVAERRQRSNALFLNAVLIIGTGLVTYAAYAALGVH